MTARSSPDMAGAYDRGVISRPCEVYWAGFRSTTAQLQQAGWELSAEDSLHRSTVRLAMRHRDYRLYGFTSEVDVDRFRYAQHAMDISPRFQVRYMASDITVTVMDNFSEFEPIDAKPQFIEERKSIEDFKIFATPLARTEEIIVDPQDVMAMLEQIKKVQAPGQRDIRKRDASRPIDDRPVQRQVFHAQILSFADRRAA